MHSKLAGQVSLHEMISSVISGAQVKIASEGEEKKDEKKALPFMKKKEEKKDDDKEKKSSADFDDVEKLASALEEVGEKIASDATYLGTEKKQGGETLATMKPVSGTQPYKHDKSKAHNVPMHTPEQKAEVGASTQVQNDHAKTPGGAAYPKKGVLKTAAEGVMAKIQALKKKDEGEKEEPKKEEKKEESDEKKKEKKSAALEFILGKMAEAKGGGEILTDDKVKTAPPSDSKGGNNVRSPLESSKAAINMKKVDGKGPQKKMLSEVLTEPAYSKSTDSKVHENLRNASKGGVKIAAAKALLQKIAEDEKDPRHEQLKKALEKKKLEKKSMGGAPAMGAGMTPPKPMGMM